MVNIDFVLVITVFIPLIVTWFSGDAWVSRNERKREHSLMLNDSISEWVVTGPDFAYVPIRFDDFFHYTGEIVSEPTV